LHALPVGQGTDLLKMAIDPWIRSRLERAGLPALL
jgi:hypothetical protein